MLGKETFGARYRQRGMFTVLWRRLEEGKYRGGSVGICEAHLMDTQTLT